MTADPRAETRANDTIILYPMQGYPKCIVAIVAFVSADEDFLHAFRTKSFACIWSNPPIVRAAYNTPRVCRIHGPPWVPLLLARRDAYPSLCTEVLNAIMQYKDTIGNSMARVLCLAHTTPSSSRSRQIFFRRERKLINVKTVN